MATSEPLCCVSVKGPPAEGGDSVVVLLRASAISTLWQCDRFIKMALPAFMTSIIKANPIMFPSEILNILQPAIERRLLLSSIACTNARDLRPAYVHFKV